MTDQPDEFMSAFRSRMLERLRDDLAVTGDEALALRKALLGLLFTGPEDKLSFRRFRDYLLREFGPLADNFDDEDAHPFIDDQEIRRLDRPGASELLIHKTLIEAVMEPPLSLEDLEGESMRIPWESSGDRFVGSFMLDNFYPTLAQQGGVADVDDIATALREAALSNERFGPWKDEPEGPLSYPGCWIRMVQHGDVMFLFTRDASERSQITMYLAAQSLFMRAVGLGYGLRGGVSFGTCTADFEQSTFTGFPIFVARQLAGRQAWYGVSFDPSTDEAVVREEGAVPPPDIGDWIPITMPYEVPIGIGAGTESLTALNWPMMFRGNYEGIDDFLDQLEILPSPNADAYKQRTRDFGHEMLKRMADEV